MRDRDELLDAPRGLFVGAAGVVVPKVMRQVAAHHDGRLRSTPQPREHVRHFCGLRVADHDGHQAELAERELQEG